MGNFLSTITLFFTDKSTSFGLKTSIIISVIAFLFVLDLTFHITYNYHINIQLNQLESINSLKSQYNDDQRIIDRLLDLENEVLKKSHYSELFSKIINYNPYGQTGGLGGTGVEAGGAGTGVGGAGAGEDEGLSRESDTTDDKKDDMKNISIVWTIISANYGLLLFSPIILLLPLIDNKNLDLKFFAGWIASLIIYTGIIFSITLIALKFIPTFENPNWNYVLNALIHTFFFSILIYASSKSNNNKKMVNK